MTKIPTCPSCKGRSWRSEVSSTGGTTIYALDPDTGHWVQADFEGDDQPDVSYFCDNCGKPAPRRTEDILSDFPVD